MATGDEELEKQLAGVVELAEAKIALLRAEIAKVQKGTNAFFEAMGRDPYYADVEDGESARQRDSVRRDQFVNYNAPSTAARAYLDWRGPARGAASIDEIYDALFAGGYGFEQKDANEAKNGLRIALGKDGAVHRLANGFYGLTSWYPDARKEKKKSAKDGKAANSTPEPPVANSEPAGPET